jgi:hypothetical protein
MQVRTMNRAIIVRIVSSQLSLAAFITVFCKCAMFSYEGIKDVVPQPTENTYEGFEDLIDRMNYWLKEQSDMYITNLQSVMVQKHSGESS